MTIAGYTLINANSQQLKQMLKRGGRARFLFVEPGGSAMAMSVARSYGAAKSMEYQVTLLRLALEKLKEIADETNPGHLEVKLMDYLPEVAMTMIDEQAEDGVVYVTHQGFNQPVAVRPSFTLERTKDSKVFTFYRTSYDNLWNWQSSRLMRVG